MENDVDSSVRQGLVNTDVCDPAIVQQHRTVGPLCEADGKIVAATAEQHEDEIGKGEDSCSVGQVRREMVEYVWIGYAVACE